ncbi:MAG TPA: hypothetical protein VE291_12110 [Terracidiphilus sp.]|jgi:hypothetical protein|nr:hypothetical protein [Terracidiphilus sp.]
MSSPDPSLQGCTAESTDSKITVKRDGRRATFDNSERAAIKCVDLDRWIPSTETKKADYVVSKPGVADVIVELKGKDIEHAVEQIVVTLGKWKSAPPYSEKVGGLIVFTRCPMRSAETNDIKKRLLIQHGLWLEMDKNQKTEYRFETFTGKRA